MERHGDYSLQKKEDKIAQAKAKAKEKAKVKEQEYVVMPTATICVRCKSGEIADFIHGTCLECSKSLQDTFRKVEDGTPNIL